MTSDTVAPCRLPGYGGLVAMNSVGAIVFVSEGLNDVLGIEGSRLMGRSFLEFVHGDDVEHAVESFMSVGRRAGYHEPLEIRVTNGDDVLDVGVVADNRLDDPDIGAVLLHLAGPSDADERLVDELRGE